MHTGQVPGGTENGSEGIFNTCDHVLRTWPGKMPLGGLPRDSSKELWCFGCQALLLSSFEGQKGKVPCPSCMTATALHKASCSEHGGTCL